MHEGGWRWVGSNKLVELKKKKLCTFTTEGMGLIPGLRSYKVHDATKINK